MTTFTVTATQTGAATENGMATTVKVVTGASLTQPGKTGSALQATPSLPITPNDTGSWVYGALLGSGTSFTALASTTFEQNSGLTGLSSIQFRTTSTTTATTPVTVGATGTVHGIGIALAEIVASGTLAEDGSSPATIAYAQVKTQTTASFTPPAGALLVLMVATNGATGTTTMAITDTSGLGLTWVQQSVANGSSSGYAGVWTAQLPAAAAVAAEGRPGPVQAASRQPSPAGGAGSGRFGRTFALPGAYSGTGPAVTPLTSPVSARKPALPRGGQVRGNAGAYSGTGPAVPELRQPAGVRTTLFRTGHVQSSPGFLSPYVTSQVYPLQGAVARRPLPRRGRVHGIVRAVALLPSNPGPAFSPVHGPVTARRPGPYVNGRAMTMAMLSFIATESGPQVYPQTSPAASIARLQGPFRTGRVSSSQGIPSAYGPPIPQQAQPWGIRLTRARTGTAFALPGTPSGQGPSVYPLRGPVRARQPLPPHGRTHHRGGTFVGVGPGVSPQQGPVRPRLQQFPYLHGRAMADVAITVTVPIILLPPEYPLHAPVRAQPGRSRPQGRVISTPAFVPPVAHLAVIPPRGSPVRAPLPGPFRKGRAEHRAGTFAGAGPQPVPARLSAPAAARLPRPYIHGHAMTMAMYSVVLSNLFGPPVYPLHGPVRAPVPPRTQRGHIRTRAGVTEGTGPSFTPLTGPVRARIPARIPGGRAHRRAGTLSGTGPQVTPLTAPVTSRRPLPPQGRVIRRAGTYAGSGPGVTPLTGPVLARRPQPTRYGRGAGSPGTFGGQGPVLRPPSGPVSDRRPLNAPRGRTAGNPGGPVVPPPPIQPPPATLYLTPGTITQAGPYAAVGVTSTGSLLTISPEQDAALTISPEQEGIAPVQVSPPPDALLPSPDETTLFPDLPG